MKVQIEIDDDKITNLFDSVKGAPYSGWIFELDANKDGGTVKFLTENEKISTNKITKFSIKKGLAAMAKEFPYAFAQVMEDNIDAVAADCFMQSVVFGKEVYA